MGARRGPSSALKHWRGAHPLQHDGAVPRTTSDQKFSVVDAAGNSHAYLYPNQFAFDGTTGIDRLVIGAASKQIQLIIELGRGLPEPFGALYVLLTPRVAPNAGRYVTDALVSWAETQAFLWAFRRYFQGDGRHNVWITASPDGLHHGGQLVYDSHNLIYAYGPIASYRRILQQAGFGEAESVTVPFPHSHSFVKEFDSEERRILNYWSWRHLPLAPEDGE